MSSATTSSSHLMESFFSSCPNSDSSGSEHLSEDQLLPNHLQEGSRSLDSPPHPTGYSTTVETLLACQEDNCPTCDGDIDALPVFLNEYARSHSDCLVCKEKIHSSWTPPSLAAVKVLKEMCIKSILPEVTVQGGVLDPSYPFCEGCTLDKLNTLSALYTQLLEVQASYDAVRFAIVAPIVTSFVEERKRRGPTAAVPSTHGERDATKLFEYWKGNLSYPVREEEEEVQESPREEQQQAPAKSGGGGNGWTSVGVGTDSLTSIWDNMFIPLPIPTTGGEGQELRIKSEPLECEDGDESYTFINQKELLPVLALEDLASQTAATGECGSPEQPSQTILPPDYSSSSSSDSDDSSCSNISTRHRSRSEEDLSINKKEICDLLLSSLGVEEDVQLPVIYTTDTPTTDLHPPEVEESVAEKESISITEKPFQNGTITRRKQKQSIIRASQTLISSIGERNDFLTSMALKYKIKAIRTLLQDLRSASSERRRAKLINSHLPPPRGRGNKGGSESSSGRRRSDSSDSENSMNELNFSEQLLLTSSSSRSTASPPLRRGRGRPRKIPVNSSPPPPVRKSLRKTNQKKKETKEEKTHSQPKRGRGRPPKVDENGNRIGPSSKKPEPVKRGRGRPRKIVKYQESGSDEENLELFKCTPNIIEGDQRDVKIPGLQEEAPKEKKRGRGRPRKRGARSPSPLNTFTDEDGVEYYEVAPPTPDYFVDSDEEKENESKTAPKLAATGEEEEIEELPEDDGEASEENERIKRRFATDSPPRKRKRSSPPTKKKGGRRNSTPPPRGRKVVKENLSSTDYEDEEEAYLAAEEEKRAAQEDEDSSDDYAIGTDLTKAMITRKKGKRSKSVSNKRGRESSTGYENNKSGAKRRGRPPKNESADLFQRKRKAPKKPPPQKKEVPIWRRHVNRKWSEPPPPPYRFVPPTNPPPDWDDVVDLSSPLHVHAFSTLLTLQVRLSIPQLELGDVNCGDMEGNQGTLFN